MNLVKPLLFFSALSSSLNAAVVFNMNISWDGETPRGQGGTHPSGVRFSTTDTAASKLAITEGLGLNNDLPLGPIAWTDGLYSGVVNVSFELTTTGTPTATLTGSPIRRGGRGAVGIQSDSGTASLLGIDEGSLSISNVIVTKVSGDNFSYDGFTGVYLGNGSAGETATTNGFATNNIPAGGTMQVANFNSVAGLPTTLEVAATAGEISINGAQIQITGVPEPTSASLLGLSALGLLLRRRR